MVTRHTSPALAISLAWGALAWAVEGLVACGGKTADIDVTADGGFPFRGPSCTPAEISDACWQCMVACAGACESACEQPLSCSCACDGGDFACQEACYATAKVSSECAACGEPLSTCEQGQCAGPCDVESSGTHYCVRSLSCADGYPLTWCQDSDQHGSCVEYYQVGPQRFDCASCTGAGDGCDAAAQAAVAACR